MLLSIYLPLSARRDPLAWHILMLSAIELHTVCKAKMCKGQALKLALT